LSAKSGNIENNTASNTGAQNLGGKLAASMPSTKFLYRESKELLFGKPDTNI